MQEGTFCPEDVSTWQYFNGEHLIDDEDANVRCSDCTKQPAFQECCKTMTIFHAALTCVF